MADRVINLEDTTIIGDVPMTRKNAIMSQKTTPAPTMTMADVAEDFIPTEYQYLRDLSPEEQSRELLKLQDKWMNEAVSKPVKRKKDDYKGAKSVLMNDASGKSVVVPVEDIPDFERRKATEENLKKLELANAPWELLMGLGGLAAAGPPIVKGKAGSRLSVSPKTAAAITALSTAVPKKAEAARLDVQNIRYEPKTNTTPARFMADQPREYAEGMVSKIPVIGPLKPVLISSATGEGSAFDLVETFLKSMPRGANPREYIRSRMIQAGYNPEPQVMDKAMSELEPLIEVAVQKLPKYENKTLLLDKDKRLEDMEYVEKTSVPVVRNEKGELVPSRKDGNYVSGEKVYSLSGEVMREEMLNQPRTDRGYGVLKKELTALASKLNIDIPSADKAKDIYNKVQQEVTTRLEAAKKALEELEKQGKAKEDTRKQNKRR